MAEPSLETQVCVLRKRVNIFIGLFTVMIGIWGSDIFFSVKSSGAHDTEAARQQEKILTLERNVQDQKKDYCTIIDKLDVISIGVAQIQTKIKIYHGENGDSGGGN